MRAAIILVSHDRYFISKTANKIWEIVDHKIKEFKGGYEEWVAMERTNGRKRQKPIKKQEEKTPKKEERSKKQEATAKQQK